MCKFNQNLFIVTILWYSVWFISIKVLHASPVDFLLLDDLIDDGDNNGDYDLHYDQRQNGTENVRFNVNGVILAIPSSSSGAAGSVAGNLATNYLLQLAAANDDDDDDDIDKYFNFVKNANTDVNAATASLVKSAESVDKNDETAKKKVAKPEKIKENAKTVVVIKDPNSNEKVKQDTVEVLSQRNNNPIQNGGQDETKAVVPAKKVQSRRRNKFKLRLGGLLNFLQRNREQHS